MKKYSFWLRAAAITQIATGLIHSISFFVSPEPANDTERQLFTLLESYKFDMGPGFHRSMGDLLTGLSMCFTLMYLLGGVVVIYLLSKRADAGVMKGLVNIYLVIFGFAFAWMAAYTFLPPIVLTGSVFVLLLVTRLLPFEDGGSVNR